MVKRILLLIDRVFIFFGFIADSKVVFFLSVSVCIARLIFKDVRAKIFQHRFFSETFTTVR